LSLLHQGGTHHLRTHMPSNKDGLNLAQPHMVIQSLTISVQEHRLPPWGRGPGGYAMGTFLNQVLYASS
jgi:hypothetical protein